MAVDLNEMPEQSLYQRIVSEYQETGSVLKTAKNTGASEVTVRRVLITEDMWSSKTSLAVNERWHMGMSVEQIAQELSVTEKAVQAYLPYRKGMYGLEQTEDAQNSRNYRERNARVKEKMHAPEMEEQENPEENHTEEADIVEMTDKERKYEERLKVEHDKLRQETEKLWKRLRPDEETIRNYAGQEFLKETLDLPDADLNTAGRLFDRLKDRVNQNALSRPDDSGKVYQLHIELEASGVDMVSSYHISEAERINKIMMSRFCEYAKADRGISRDILVPGNMTLHALHYAIMKLFGFLGYHLHNFELTDADFNRVTGARVGGYKDLCGILFQFPDRFESDNSWDDDFDGTGSIKNWYKKKYTAPFYRAGLRDTWYTNTRAVEEFNSEHPEIPDEMLVNEMNRKWLFEGAVGCLTEDLTVQELFTLAPWTGEMAKGCPDPEHETDACAERWHDIGGDSRMEEPSSYALDEAAEWKNRVLGRRKLVETAFSNKLKEDDADFRDMARKLSRYSMMDVAKTDRKSGKPDAESCESEEENRKILLDRACRLLDRTRDSLGNLEWNIDFEPEKIKRELEAKGTSVEDQLWFHKKDIWDLTEMLDFLFNDYNVHPDPAFREIRYRYDYGDDWQFRIRAEEIYTRVQDDDAPAGMIQKEAMEKYRYRDSRGDDVSDELRGQLAKIDVKGKPICIASDGLNLVEDVGGVYGLYEFFASVNGPQTDWEQKEQRDGNLEWARGLGWTGRKTRPENML